MPGPGQGRDVGDIRGTQFRRPRDQCCTIEDGGDAAEQLRGERKEIAAVELQLPGLVNVEVLENAAPRGNAMLQAERFQGNGRDLHARHAMMLLQPQKVEALAAQRHEHAPVACNFQVRPVLLKVPVHGGLMKTDLTQPPTIVPKLRLQDSKVPRTNRAA